MTARDRTVLLVLAAVAVVAGFWFAVLAPKRDEATKLSGEVAAAQQRLDEARSVAANAEGARRRYAQDYATVARLGKAVPVDDDVPSLVFQLQTSAFHHDLDFRSVKLEASATPASTAVNNTNAVAAAAGKQPADGSNGAAAPATNAVAAVLPPGAAVGAAGFPTMPFAFEFDGGFFDMQRFLREINGFTSAKGDRINVRGRLLTVDGFALQASRRGFPQVKASIRATAYLLPGDQGLTPGGATPSGPAAGGATASTSTAPTTSAVIAGGTR